MLRAANGLHGDALVPWYLRAHYKTYDAYGKSKGEGTLEYVWAGPRHWHITYAEGATVWTRWNTEKGLYAPPGQPEKPGYPETLITQQIRDPLRHVGASTQAPPYFAAEEIGSFPLSCFSNVSLVQTAPEHHSSTSPLMQRFCADAGKPRLRLIQNGYNIYLNKLSSFQHRIVAMTIQVRDGGDPVVDIYLDELRSALPEEIDKLSPPAEMVQLRDNTLLLPPEIASGHRLKIVNPRYPADMKQAHIQGTVRLAVTISKDGRMTITDVLHSPHPSLTAASEDAVRQWVYTPYLKDGQPVEFSTTVSVTYTLDR